MVSRRAGGVRGGYLYRVDRAKPVRPMTSRKWGALALATLARRTCPRCLLDVGYCIQRSRGIRGMYIDAEKHRAA